MVTGVALSLIDPGFATSTVNTIGVVPAFFDPTWFGPIMPPTVW